MPNLQRVGGVAALAAAAAFITGFALYIGLLVPARYGSLQVDAARHVAFLVEHQTTLYAWNLVIYVLFGVALVLLNLALQERLAKTAQRWADTAAAFGLIWAALMFASGMLANIGAAATAQLHVSDPARAAQLWLTTSVVVSGLGGGNEIVGGLWLSLISVATLRTPELPRALGYIGMVVGAAGVVTVVPALKEVGAVFGLGLIAWFAWTGVVLLRGSGPDETSE